MGSEEMKTASADLVLALKRGTMLEGLGMQEMHRQVQKKLRITSELEKGKLQMSAPASARPPGGAGDTASPRAHPSAAEGNRMRLDRFQA